MVEITENHYQSYIIIFLYWAHAVISLVNWSFVSNFNVENILKLSLTFKKKIVLMFCRQFVS